MKVEQRKLEFAISAILRIGVLLSLVLLTAGIVAYYFTEGTYDIMLEQKWSVNTTNFFTFIPSIISGSSLAYILIASGIAVLMMTPYLRVIASIIYFALTKDGKYLLITTIVLVIITVSLVRL
jgi:uncharacterized membrane protein